MKILISGSKGQLGQTIKKISGNYAHEFVFTDVEELDITSKEAITELVSKEKPDFFINAAAYTAVDNAEEEKDKCSLINHQAVENIASVCEKENIYFIHISTDYVFDGKSSHPYSTFDKANPLSVYGKTKFCGEKSALEICKKSFVIRTSGLYSEYGKNFVKTMLTLCKEKELINVVYDQTMSPCFATDLAKAIMSLIDKVSECGMPEEKYRLLHFSNEGVLSWFDLAKKVNDLAGLKCNINPILSANYPTKAKRPEYSVLDKSLLKEYLQCAIPHWEDALKECLSLILK
ncbi:MAG: dTDP-4-dehydrorhamnose reductase [Bacteroidales bacterium]|nr:dTDP-4-dehydrorhamnose reductase [Bacteroidales bacterium]